MTGRIAGAGGYPVGVGGKALVMLSGGIDSPVASYLTMKRGVAIECVHYASPPYTSQAAQDKVLELARQRGSERVFLEVRASNTPAITLYEQSGFERVGVTKAYFRNPREDAVNMRLVFGA